MGVAQIPSRRLAEALAGLNRLSQTTPPPDEFYGAWLGYVVALCEARGGQLRRPATNGSLSVVAGVKFATSSTQESEAGDAQPSRYSKLILETFSSGRPKAVPPASELGPDADANPTAGVLLLAPLAIDDETRGVVELVVDEMPNQDRMQQILRALAEASPFVGGYERRCRERSLQARQALVDEVEQFTRAIHAQLSVRHASYAVANDGRRLIGCDRLTVLVRRGKRYRVAAVSGLEVVETRSQAAKLLSRLAETVAETGEAVWFSGRDDELPPQIRTALGAYVDEAHVRGVAVLPLLPPVDEARPHRRRRPLGALVVEQIENITTVAGREERAQLVATHATTALTNALQHEAIPLLPIWRLIGESQKLFAPGTRSRTFAALAAILLAAAALKFIPAAFALHAKATLQPKLRQHTFAPLDGTVQKIHVRHGQHVEVGQLLVELRNTDLDVSLADVVGQRTAAGEQLLSVERALFEDGTKLAVEERHRLAGQRSELKQKLASLDEQLRLLRRKREQLKVTSPIAGEVTTWNVEQLLENRPVRQGQVLVDVADTSGPWELELQVPEDGIGHLLRAQQESGPALHVSYRLAVDPEHDRNASVQEVHYAAEVRGEEGNTVLVRSDLQSGELPPLRPGAEATAKIYCGTRALGYVWLHDAVDFVKSKILFRLY